MRSYELNQAGQTVPITEHPMGGIELEMEYSPILRYMYEQRMKMAQLFGGNRTLQMQDPFAQPTLPEEIKPRFDVGGGR